MVLILSIVSPTYAQSEQLKIITFGDSITAGLSRVQDQSTNISCPPGVSKEQDRFTDDGRFTCYGNGAANVGGYQPALKQNLDPRGFETTIFNWGFSGAKTSDMVNLRGSVLASNPDAQYVLILGGANDAFPGINPGTVKFNLGVILDSVINQGMIPILATPTPYTRRASNVSLYSAVIRELGAERNVLVTDHLLIMDSGWISAPFHSGDFLHLNALGNAQLAANWTNTLDFDLIMEPEEPEAQPTPLLSPIYLLLLD